MAKRDRTREIGRADLDYIDSASGSLNPALAAIEEAAEPDRIPILNRDSGRVLAALAASRRRILEIGTAYGYSTLWMALAQPPGGTIVTIDPDRSRTDKARGWWRGAGVPDEQIEVVTAKALEAFRAQEPALEGPFDLAFIDAIKTEYPGYAEAVVPRLSTGGLLVADNVLWSGRVAADDPDPGDDTQALRSFNAGLLADPRFVTTILPVGDGLLVATYKG
jgi:caffeoyl-CoA O-methyltransferase